MVVDGVEGDSGCCCVISAIADKGSLTWPTEDVGTVGVFELAEGDR